MSQFNSITVSNVKNPIYRVRVFQQFYTYHSVQSYCMEMEKGIPEQLIVATKPFWIINMLPRCTTEAHRGQEDYISYIRQSGRQWHIFPHALIILPMLILLNFTFTFIVSISIVECHMICATGCEIHPNGISHIHYMFIVYIHHFTKDSLLKFLNPCPVLVKKNMESHIRNIYPTISKNTIMCMPLLLGLFTKR